VTTVVLVDHSVVVEGTTRVEVVGNGEGEYSTWVYTEVCTTGSVLVAVEVTSIWSTVDVEVVTTLLVEVSYAVDVSGTYVVPSETVENTVGASG
jgi:hypothetical protein